MVTDGYRQVSGHQATFGKLFDHNGMVIGTSGSCSEAVLMELFSKNHRPASSDRIGVIDFLLEFEDSVKKRESGYCLDNQYLIAIEGKLFTALGRLDVYEVEAFDAIGCGRDFGNAALLMGATVGQAADVACQLSAFCAPPIVEKAWNNGNNP